MKFPEIPDLQGLSEERTCDALSRYRLAIELWLQFSYGIPPSEEDQDEILSLLEKD